MCSDDGAAGLAAVAVIALVVAVAVGIGGVGAAVLARHRAQAAADLAALAAAARVAAGYETACAQAHSVAAAMRADVVGCVLYGLDVVVEVRTVVGTGAWALGPARAAARAGPV